MKVTSEEIAKVICGIEMLICELEKKHPEITLEKSARREDKLAAASRNPVRDVSGGSLFGGFFVRAASSCSAVINTVADTVFTHSPLNYIAKFRELYRLLDEAFSADPLSVSRELYESALKLLQLCGYNIPYNIENKTRIYIESRKNYRENTSASFLIKNLLEAFRYLPLSDLPTVALVCCEWANKINVIADWNGRLQRDFGLSFKNCMRIEKPEKVYRRLQSASEGVETVGRVGDNRQDSNRTRLLEYLEEMLFLIRTDAVDIRDYPEIFFPYTDPLGSRFEEKVHGLRRGWLAFWLEHAVAMNNFEFTRFILRHDDSLCDWFTIQQSYIAGDMQLIRYLSDKNTYWCDLQLPVLSGNLGMLKFLVEDCNEIRTSFNFDQVLRTPVRLNRPKMLQFLFDTFAEPISRLSAEDLDTLKCILLSHFRASPMAMQLKLLQCLNMTVADIPKDEFIQWIVTNDFLKLQWLMNARVTTHAELAMLILSIHGDNLPIFNRRFSDWNFHQGGVREYLTVLFESNDAVYHTAGLFPLDPNSLFAWRCICAIEKDDSEKLGQLLQANAEIVSEHYLKRMSALVIREDKYSCCEYLLKNHPIRVIGQLMDNGFGHAHAFKLAKASPEFSALLPDEDIMQWLLELDYSFDFRSYASLRFINALFDMFNLQFPDNWSVHIKTAPRYIKEFFEEKFAEQHAHVLTP
ncbi:MAG: hypothetical protein M3R00_03230 [Pseudomonadota bacterium]|nr:hypothetical protein [Pseudomonadota bacterium]